jgi:large subunit ribosomal protein L4
MAIPVQKADGSQAGTVELPASVFDIEPNEAVVHQYVVHYLANQRQGTASAKGRSDTRGGGSKPWRQKGTGRARAGTIRSPLWQGGGVVFGPSPRDFGGRLPKKQKRLALLSVLSDKARSAQVRVVEKIDFPDHKTKNFSALLDALDLKGKKVLVLDESKDRKPFLSARNIPGLKMSRASLTNAYDVLNAEVLLMTPEAIKTVEEVFG